MQILSVPISSTDFVMNLTTSKFIFFSENEFREFDFFYYFLIAASVSLAVNMDSNIIPRNGKHYLKVRNVKVKVLDINYSVDLHSKSLSPFVNGIVNNVMNYFVILHSDFENYAACVMSSLVELIFDKLAIEDVFVL